MSDTWDYVEQIVQDAAEEDAYYREKDREIEEAWQNLTPTMHSDHLPGSMGGCFCV